MKLLAALEVAKLEGFNLWVFKHVSLFGTTNTTASRYMFVPQKYAHLLSKFTWDYF